MATVLDPRILRAPLDAPVWRDGPSSTDATVDVRPVPVDAPVADVATPIAMSTTGASAIVGDVATAAAPVEDELATLLNARPIEGNETILRARCDDIARRIVREGGHISIAALSREIGSAPTTVKRLMAMPVFRRIYDEVSGELLGSVDDQIRDERLDVLARQDSLQRRAMTVLGEAMEMVRAHKDAVALGAVVRPGLLKVGIEAAAEIRQIGTARSAIAAGAPSNISVSVTRNQAIVIQGAMRESGIDLSDVLEGVLVPSGGGVQ